MMVEESVGRVVSTQEAGAGDPADGKGALRIMKRDRVPCGNEAAREQYPRLACCGQGPVFAAGGISWLPGKFKLQQLRVWKDFRWT